MKTQTSNPKSEITSQLSWLPKKTFELKVTIPKVLIDRSYEHVLKHAVEQADIQGFRKGKAPVKMVEERIGKDKLYSEAATHIVSQAYADAVKQHNLNPIISPQIEPIDMKEGQDWVFKATSAEAPDVKLGNYKDAIKSLKAKDKIWTPDKAASKDDQKPEVTLEKIFEELLKHVDIELPDLVVEKEVNRMMTNLLDQVNALGMTVQQYLAAKNLSQEQIRAESKAQAEANLKLDFAIAQIAVEEKISVTEQDIQSLIDQTKDPKAKTAMQKPEEKLYLMILLRRQKAVDFLKSL